MMNDFLGPKPIRSIAAFLWMPQLRFSFQHMAHIGPVFVRTLALVFMQAGLLPSNHPALMYGAAGVRKHGAREVIGEAWYTLRNTRATVNQWGIFTGVMLMMAMVIGSLVTFLMTIAFGASTARAQLFSHPLGDSSSDAYPGTGGSPFDMIVPPAGTPQGDYGIMMLDKVLRAGATGQGTPLQNATRDLMHLYNSGILVIASVIIFWMILSIVVDTAKTGQVGGGRHNMVWVPIRIVFALALLIPLGATGFSSGQFMIMKVAEWGSNFGTRAWGAYVDSVTSSQNLLAKDSPFSPTDVVLGYQRLWLCMAAFNANEHMGGGSLRVYPFPTTPGGGERVISFSHRDQANACGSVRMEIGPSIVEASNAWGQDTQTRAALTFKNQMRVAYATGLAALEEDMKTFACRFLQARPGLGTSAPDMAAAGCEVAPAGYTENDIPYADLVAMVTTYGNRIKTQFDTSFETYNREVSTTMMKDRGWAGMGAWYHRISQLNGAVGAVMQAPVAFTGPALEETAAGSAAKAETLAIMASFDAWWVSRSIENSSTNTENVETSRVDTNRVETSEGGINIRRAVNQLKNTNNRNALDAVVDLSGVNSRGAIASFIAHSAGGSHGQTYPLAMISNIGGNIFWTGSIFVGATIILNVLISVSSGNVTGGLVFNGAALANNMFFPLLAKLGYTLMAAGMMLKFYVPLIPFVRTLFSVLTWIISVFEAVVMVPFAALSLLSTDGEGLGSGAQRLWPLWLNVLVRPILTVVAFVGAMLVYNAFVAFVNDSVLHSLVVGLPSRGILGVFTGFVVALVYVFIMYTVANTVFKMLDLIPSALMRWMGGQADQSFDDHGDKAILLAASNMVSQMGAPSHVKYVPKQPPKPDVGTQTPTTPP